MKKTPPLERDPVEDVTSGDDAPLLPGTEEPRSLGDMMIEAERKAQTVVDQQTGSVSKKRQRSKKPSRSQARRYARERALQALYQWEVSGAESSTVKTEFLDTQEMGRVDTDYFVLLFTGISHHPQAIDDVLKPCLDRPIEDLDLIERAVLRIAAYELTQQVDIPARVVINEGIEITKRFGADKGHRYVNGVLDKLAVSLRPLEMNER